MANVAQELEDYGVRIAEKMLATQHHAGLVMRGKFKKLGCIDSEVQKHHPTDLTVAGVLAYWEANQRGGAFMVLETLADLGQDDKAFEFHWPCGQLLLELGINTWTGQADYASYLTQRVEYFNLKNKSRFSSVVHPHVGTAGNYLK